MDYEARLAISFYKTISVLNEDHEVYLVRHQNTQKIYVKKILTIYNKQVYEYLKEHPIAGTPRIIELCEEDDHLILIEEFINGTTLQEMIDQHICSVSDIRNYLIDLCSILHKLHSHVPPLIHRDIKPSNIILTEEDHVILLDFNAAKYSSASKEADTMLIGTKGYAAPEQYGFGSSTPQTDIYAVGILCKELCASVTPACHSFDAIIDKCTQMNPADRYASVLDLKSALESSDSPGLTAKADVKSFRSFLPPGFRTGKISHMFLAIIGYALSLWLIFAEAPSGYSLPHLIIRRTTLFLMLFSVIGTTFNYLGIQRFFPLCQSRKWPLRLFGILLADIALYTLFAIIGGLFEYLVFS